MGVDFLLDGFDSLEFGLCVCECGGKSAGRLNAEVWVCRGLMRGGDDRLEVVKFVIQGGGCFVCLAEGLLVLPYQVEG